MYQHLSACISIYQHVSASIGIYQHVSACISMYQHLSACISMYQHVSACVSIYQHVSACISMRQHLSASISMYQHLSASTCQHVAPASLPPTQRATFRLISSGGLENSVGRFGVVWSWPAIALGLGYALSALFLHCCTLKHISYHHQQHVTNKPLYLAFIMLPCLAPATLSPCC